MKKNDPNKVTGKDLLSSMSQFKEVYMQDYFRHSNTNFEDNPIESVDKSYLEVRGHFFYSNTYSNIFIVNNIYLLSRENFYQYSQ